MTTRDDKKHLWRFLKKNDDGKGELPSLFNYEKDGKRESSSQCATNVSMDLGIDIMISED